MEVHGEMHFPRSCFFAFVALAGLAVAPPSAGATTARRPVTIGRHVYDVSAIVPSRADTVAAFVAKLQRAHDDRTLDWVNDRNVSAATRAAVIAYVAKPGTITITRSVVDEPSTTAASRYTCKVE